jgi:hypothetical protein
LTRKPALKKLLRANPDICTAKRDFTPDSGKELRQCGDEMRHYLVFGSRIGYALSRRVRPMRRSSA